MDELMRQVQELYRTLSNKMATVKARETALTEIANELKTRELEIEQLTKEVKEKEKEHKDIDMALVEQVKAKEMMAEVRKEREALGDAEVIVSEAKREAKTILDNAKAIDEEVKATRARLLVEVDRVAKEKENLKQQILDELAGRA